MIFINSFCYHKMKFFYQFLSFISFLFLLGCAPTLTEEKIRKEAAEFKLPKEPAKGKAIIYVVRPSFLGGFIRFNTFVDNNDPKSEVGYTRGGQYIHFDITPGNHTILSQAENLAKLDLTAKAGDVLFVMQEPTMGFIMSRNTLSEIPEFLGKYYVKNLTLGTLLSAGCS